MDYPQIVHGLSMDYPWIIQGLSRDCPWRIQESQNHESMEFRRSRMMEIVQVTGNRSVYTPWIFRLY
jgi:hypothetical protein